MPTATASGQDSMSIVNYHDLFTILEGLGIQPNKGGDYNKLGGCSRVGPVERVQTTQLPTHQPTTSLCPRWVTFYVFCVLEPKLK